MRANLLLDHLCRARAGDGQGRERRLAPNNPAEPTLRSRGLLRTQVADDRSGRIKRRNAAITFNASMLASGVSGEELADPRGTRADLFSALNHCPCRNRNGRRTRALVIKRLFCSCEDFSVAAQHLVPATPGPSGLGRAGRSGRAHLSSSCSLDR